MNPEHADTVLVGGSVFRDGGSRPGGVAVIRQRIALVGTDDEVRATVGPRTEVVDVAGGLVLPGFQDAHAHPLAAGVDMLRCDLTGCRSADDVLARVRDYADANPDLAWLLGSGWSMSDFERGCPSREQLDAVQGAMSDLGDRISRLEEVVLAQAEADRSGSPQSESEVDR